MAFKENERRILYSRISDDCKQLTEQGPFSIGYKRSSVTFLALQLEVELKNLRLDGLGDDTILNSHFKSIVSPAAKLHLTILIIKREPSDIYWTG